MPNSFPNRLRSGLFPTVDRIEGHSFLSASLGSESVVVDLGINQANFAHELHALTGCRVVGVEASPKLAEAAPQRPWLRVENVAITGIDGPVNLHLNEGRDASLLATISEDDAGTVSVPGVTLQNFLSAQGISAIDLMKVDIEGAEIAMFDTTDDDILENVAQITIEFHDFMDTAMARDVARIKDRLRGLGFLCINFSRNNADVLFLNRRHIDVSGIGLLYMRAVYKYVRGFGRQLSALSG